MIAETEAIWLTRVGSCEVITTQSRPCRWKTTVHGGGLDGETFYSTSIADARRYHQGAVALVRQLEST